MKNLLKTLRMQRGSITVLTAALMFTLVGMVALVTDVGFLYVNKNQLQNMTDAGALAGAQEYFVNQAQVVSYATDYALNKNGKSGDIVSVDINTTDKKVTVTANRTVDLFFAKIFNMQTANVAAVSAAKIVGVSSIKGAAPFGINDTDFIVGNTYTLKVGQGYGLHGNFHNLAYNDKGGKDLRENIIYGFDDSLYVGQIITTEPGSKVGPVRQGVAARIIINPVIIVPVVSDTSKNGRAEVTVLGFTAFYLNSSNGHTVTGQFINYVTAAEVGSGGGDYGLYGTKLVEP